MSDPKPSIRSSSSSSPDYSQPMDMALDPLDTLLASEADADVNEDFNETEVDSPPLSLEEDDERLYTDEFIRANEKASRSLFLGFLGLALLATSLVAWLILSPEQQDASDEVPSEPITVPGAPPEQIPDLRLDSVPPVQTPSEENSQPSDLTQPLTFPAQPSLTPDSSEELSAPTAPESDGETSQPVPPLNDQSVPPPPPINP